MEWFNYLLKVSACSALFFAFYLLFLRRLTFFKFNRFYLLFTLLLSFVIPSLQFTVEREVEAATILKAPISTQNERLTEQVSRAPIATAAPSSPTTQSFEWFSLLPYFYLTVVLFLLGLATWRLLQLFKYAKQNTKQINGLKLVHKSGGFTNCSFFNYVFIDENTLTENELQILLRHEEIHSRQYHSLDKIMLIIVKAVLWFNPIVYLYDTALEQLHEYEADELTSQGFGAETYANLLVRLTIAKSEMPLVHNFVKSPIKDRIKMLFNSKSKNMKKLIYLLAVPIGLGLLWGFTVKLVDVSPKIESDRKKLASTLNVKEQTVSFINRKVVKVEDGTNAENIKITVNNQTVANLFTGDIGVAKLYFSINDKIYTEAEAMKFSSAFIAQLSDNNGVGNLKTGYEVPGIEESTNNFVIWFGKEPKLANYAAKNKAYYEKYNGKTVEGKVIGFTFSAAKVMNGFLVKTKTGETLKANVEAKFAKQTGTMIAKNDNVSIKIYNANYKQDSEYPVLVSYKISKAGKLLYDKWPKG